MPRFCIHMPRTYSIPLRFNLHQSSSHSNRYFCLCSQGGLLSVISLCALCTNHPNSKCFTTKLCAWSFVHPSVYGRYVQLTQTANALQQWNFVHGKIKHTVTILKIKPWWQIQPWTVQCHTQDGNEVKDADKLSFTAIWIASFLFQRVIFSDHTFVLVRVCMQGATATVSPHGRFNVSECSHRFSYLY